MSRAATRRRLVRCGHSRATRLCEGLADPSVRVGERGRLERGGSAPAWQVGETERLWFEPCHAEAATNGGVSPNRLAGPRAAWPALVPNRRRAGEPPYDLISSSDLARLPASPSLLTATRPAKRSARSPLQDRRRLPRTRERVEGHDDAGSGHGEGGDLRAQREPPRLEDAGGRPDVADVDGAFHISAPVMSSSHPDTIVPTCVRTDTSSQPRFSPR